MVRRVSLFTCTICQQEKPNEEKVSRKVEMWGKTNDTRVRYRQYVCRSCALEEVKGKPTSPARTRPTSAPARDEAYAQDDAAA